MKTILPGATIGILGGGQLGRMIAIEAKKMGYFVICLDPNPYSPAGQVADDQIGASFSDLTAALQLAERCDVVVYEFENVDAQVAEHLEKKGVLPQGSRILKIAQDRIIEKTAIAAEGYPVAPFIAVENGDKLVFATGQIGLPCVLKSARGGYDGKGQRILREQADVFSAAQEVSASGRQWVLEKYLSLIGEVSVIVARKESGEVRTFPVAENTHRNNILHTTVVPTVLREELQNEAKRIAIGLAECFAIVGLLAVEFFVTSEGLIVNEIAPRPHNSGHFTFDACFTSQFEQMIRAVTNLPFGSVELLYPA
ncbi:MAG: 5-(carboxyamino)imidazole ribonucleotide synthase, partial [bacterium]|nr:5-(carboxyamino)imidazole ribonucleotide synthase [bacterium]